MSEKCNAYPKNISKCQRELSRGRNKSSCHRSTVRRKRLPDATYENSRRSSPNSSRNKEKSNSSRVSKCTLGKSSVRPITKTSRTEHLTKCGSNNVENGTSELKNNDELGERKGTDKNKKCKQKRNTKRKRKKKKSRVKKRQVWGSSACSRLIELLHMSCSCLKTFDRPSSFARNDDRCRCCRCHCRCCDCCSYRPAECDSKYVQCDDCECFVTAVESPRNESPDFRSDSKSKITPRSTKGRHVESRQYITLQHLATMREKETTDSRLILSSDEQQETSSLRSRYRNTKRKSCTGIQKSVVKGLTSMRCFVKHRTSDKFFIDEGNIGKNCVVVGSTCEQLKSTLSSEIPRQCSGDCGKTPKALLIMFDIVFWPYTCWPGRRSRDNNKTSKN